MDQVPGVIKKNMRRFIEAVIFDMDGVLVDTEPIHGRAWTQVLEQCGCTLPPGWYRDWFGASDRLIAPVLVEKYAVSVGVEELLKGKYSLAVHLLETESESFPGLPEALRSMDGARLAMCTSSKLEEAVIALRRTGIISLFEVMIASDHVRQKKPAPDAYLLAAGKLNLPPHKCMVVEDTAIGIEAAKQAGMRVVAVRTSQPDRMLAQAEQIFDSTVDAIRWLKKYIHK